MNNSKLIELLKTFSRKEILELGKFVDSPFFNKLNKVKQLYAKIRKHYPDFQSKQLVKEKIFSQLYPEQKYNDEKFRNLVSDLLNLALKYLTYISFEKNSLNTNEFLLKELLLRDKPKLFDKIFSQSLSTMDDIKIKDENYYMFKLEYEKVLTPYLENYKKDFMQIDINQQRIEDNLIDFFLISILKLYSYMANQRRTLLKHETFDLRLLNEIINHISENNGFYKDDVYVNIYYNVLLLMLKNEDIHYYTLKKLVNENFIQIETFAVKNVYVMMMNYCQEKIYKGIKIFESEIFELEKEIYMKRIYKFQYIAYSAYRNAVIHAINVNEFEWAEKFIRDYKNSLLKEFRNSGYNCCYALLYLYKKKYSNSLDYLSKVKTDHLSFKLDVKSITALIYYEQNETESLISLLDAYKHLLSKSKILSEKFKPFYFNFVKFMEKLLETKTRVRKIDLKKLEKEIINSDTFFKSWLLEKLNGRHNL